MEHPGNYSDHVSMLPGNVPCVTCDRILSVLLVIFSILGLLGNSAACTYFQSNEKTGLAPRLYTMICAIDMATSLTGFPVAVSLFAERKPVLFNNQTFCTIWNIAFRYLQIISMYLVLLLSVTRCILISFPFYTIKKQGVFASFVVYTVFLMVMNLVVAVIPSLNLVSQYSSDVAYCYDWFGANGTKTGMMIKYVAFVFESGIPPILTFFSFLITVFRISRGTGSESFMSQIKRKSVNLIFATRNEMRSWTPGREVVPCRRHTERWVRTPKRRHTDGDNLDESVNESDKDIRMRRIALLRGKSGSEILKVASTRMTSITKEKRKASITVAIFTVIFLLCNLPFFIVVLNDIFDLKSYYDDVDDSGSEEDGRDLYIAGYTWILSRLHFTVLNAMLNPIMYSFRMEGFKFWLLRKFSREQHPNLSGRARGLSTYRSSSSLESRYMLRRNLTI